MSVNEPRLAVPVQASGRRVAGDLPCALETRAVIVGELLALICSSSSMPIVFPDRKIPGQHECDRRRFAGASRAYGASVENPTCHRPRLGRSGIVHLSSRRRIHSSSSDRNPTIVSAIPTGARRERRAVVSNAMDPWRGSPCGYFSEVKSRPATLVAGLFLPKRRLYFFQTPDNSFPSRNAFPSYPTGFSKKMPDERHLPAFWTSVRYAVLENRHRQAGIIHVQRNERSESFKRHRHRKRAVFEIDFGDGIVAGNCAFWKCGSPWPDSRL